MKASTFAEHKEYPLTWEEDAEALSYIEIMKDMLVDHGFSQAAVDALQFDVRAYTVTVSEQEKAFGVWHRYDGGVPFYEVSVKCEASLDDLDIRSGRFDARSLPVPTQTAHMLVDLAANCFAKIERLSSHFGSAASNDNMIKQDGFQLDVSNGLEVHFTTRRGLDEFFGMAADSLLLHLKGKPQQSSAPRLVGGTDAPGL